MCRLLWRELIYSIITSHRLVPSILSKVEAARCGDPRQRLHNQQAKACIDTQTSPPPIMSSQPTKKDCQIKKILFPIRRQPKSMPMQQQGRSIIPSNLPEAALVKKRTERVEWIGLTPLEMVEEVVSMADNNLDMNIEDSNNTKTSLKLDTAFLACKAREVPQSIQRNSTLNAKRNCMHLPKRVTKRGRACCNADGADICKKKPAPAAYLVPWNNLFITDCDYTKEGHDAVDVLGQLALQIESSACYDLHISSYRRIRDQFMQSWVSITKQCSESRHVIEISNSIRHDLDILYEETVDQMESLLNMDMEMEMKVPASSIGTQNISSGSRMPKEFSKKSLADYMNRWLKDHWTNPYPDDEGLMIIAEEVGTTPIVVSNWLINARTRKWRPAIVKAFNLGRPAGMLKQDAINIFEGKPVHAKDQTEPDSSE